MTKLFFLFLFFSFAAHANCQTVDFTISTSNNLFCAPSTVTFTQACTGNPTNFIWDFGNGTYGDQPSQPSTYATSGSYTIKLVAIFKNSTLSVSKTIYVNPTGTVSIDVDRNYICQPGIINFTGTGSNPIANYEWNFADGTPVADVTTNTISHSFAAYGTNNVTLKTTDNAGCVATASKSIAVTQLPITGFTNRTNGCIPATVNFTSNVTLPTGSSVTSYTWDYGDGTSAITPIGTTSQTYVAVGGYYPTLSVITSEGCSNTLKFNQLYFGTPPINGVAYSKKDSVCGSDSVVLVAKATNANSYYWQFGDGTPNVTTTDTIVKHKFATVGVKNIGVISYFNRCPGTFLRVRVVVVGVIAKFSFANTCSNKNTYLFTDTSSGKSTSRLWTFGDNTPTSSDSIKLHPFPIPGMFATKLFVQDSLSGCADSSTKTIYTATPALVSPDTAVCKNSNVIFSISNNYTNASAQYTWSVVGTTVGPAANDAIAVKATMLGSFNNNYVVIDNGQGSCRDTINLNRQILVKGPNLDFTVPASVCLTTPLNITNNSKPFIAADSIHLWYWNYGNAVVNDTLYQPAPLQYASGGSYNIKLVGIDINGCMDSLVKNVTIFSMPFLHLLSKNDTLCYGLTDTLVAFHNSPLLWSPAAGLSCVTCDTTLATPLLSSKYYATSTNSNNCSVQDSVSIIVSVPFTATITPGDVYICQQQTATVEVGPKGKVIVWSPVNGLSSTTVYSPSISPLQSTTYTATLSDSTGCTSNSSSATVNVIVKSSPTVNAGPDASYPKDATYKFAPTYSNNVSTYLWTPSDLLSCNNCNIPTGIAARSQVYVVQVTSDSGCVAFDSVIISIECKYANLFIPKAFTPNNDNLNDVFYPNTFGIKTITKFIIFNRGGQVMFQRNNFSPNDRSMGWDGTYKGSPQAAGSYVYIMEALCDLGEKLFKKDSFILLR